MSLATMAAGRTRRILIVDDDDAVRRTVATHLSRLGFDITEAVDAASALIEAQKTSRGFDLVITDVHMPGLSGVELAKLLLARSPLRPVIVITGDRDETLARKALAQGASGYLLKPFELFELDSVLEQSLSMLQLVEATESVARTEAAQERNPVAGALPEPWLKVADERSGAGAGHGYRVARMASAILADLGQNMPSPDRAAVDVAARAHEMGRLLGSAPGAPELAARTSQLLADLGVTGAAVEIVRHMHENWDGSGGPDGLSADEIPLGSQVLAAADAIDHNAVLHISMGVQPEEAAASAVSDIMTRAGTVFSPDVVQAVSKARSSIQAIWTLAAAWVSE